MQPERVVIAGVTAIVAAVVAITIVVAVVVVAVVAITLTGLRDAIALVRTCPPQRMQAVLLISTGSLSLHRFASSIDGSLAPCFNSKLLGDTMAAAWVKNIA
jgi:hypothetical protein